MKSLDRRSPENAKLLLKVLQGEDNQDRNQNLNRMPLTHKIKHPEGKVQGSYPNPNPFAEKRVLARRGKGESLGADLARGGKAEGAADSMSSKAAAEIDGLGHGRLGRSRRKKEKRPREAPGRGLYPPTTGSPNALNVAPDASGDHRTHAQRRLQKLHRTGRWSPDAGFSVRCFRLR